MDEAGSFMAKLQSSIIVPIMYKMVHTGKLPKFMKKKINEADESRKKLIDGFVNMFGIDKGGSPWITKQSVYNQFYSDLVTKVQHEIDVPGTTIHFFFHCLSPSTAFFTSFTHSALWQQNSSSCCMLCLRISGFLK